MPKLHSAYLSLAFLVTLFFIERLGMYFLAKDKLSQVLFLEVFWIAALFIAVLLILLDKADVLRSLLKEDSDIEDLATSIALGTAAGFFLAIFSYSGIVQAVTEVTIQSASQVDKLSQIKLDLVGQDSSATKSIAISYIFNTFHVAFAEEILMAVLTGLILVAFGIKYQVNSINEFNNPFAYIALLVRGVLFAALHIFAYTIEQGFSAGRFISAVIGGYFFGAVLLWRGLVAAIFAHGSFNFFIDMLVSSGWTFMFATLGKIAFVAVLGLMIFKIVKKEVK